MATVSEVAEFLGVDRDKVRRWAKEFGEYLSLTAPAKEVVAALSKQRVKVTPQQVYMVKTAMGKKPSKRGSPYEALLAVKQLVDKLGSVEKAREALDVLAKLR